MHLLRAPLLLLLLCLLPAAAPAKTDKAALRRSVAAAVRASGAKVGIAAMRLSGGPPDSVQFNGPDRFPMQSVYKFPLALAVLDRVRAGRLSLDQLVHIRRAELDSDTWSPMYQEYSQPAFDLKLSQLIRYAVSQSDNNACDVLFALIGGPGAAQQYLDDNGIAGIRMAATERQMHADSKVQYANWATPRAMLHLLERFGRGDLLNPPLSGFLYEAMVKTENSPNRIGGQLPVADLKLAHKTGTSGTDQAGMTAAVNDAGILTYRSDKIAIVVFVSGLKGNAERGERLIAQISRLLWDYYMQ